MDYFFVFCSLFRSSTSFENLIFVVLNGSSIAHSVLSFSWVGGISLKKIRDQSERRGFVILDYLISKLLYELQFLIEHFESIFHHSVIFLLVKNFFRISLSHS